MLVAEVGILKLSYALVDFGQKAAGVLLLMVNRSFLPRDLRILIHEGRHF